MIRLVNLSKRYRAGKGSKTVLDNVSADFPPGRNLGILGRNGAGKSTLLRLIGGAEKPTSGKILREGRVSWPIGFSGGFHGSLTGRENLRFICRIYQADIRRVTRFVDEFAELGAYMEMPVNTYSSGMRAKLAFGLSMAIDFEYYLIDEITAVGDASFKRKSEEEFARRKDRSTLLVVSHNVGTIKNHCDVAAVLENGCLTMFDDVDSAVKYYEYFMAESRRAV
ncbi:MAG: ABC transporter ATP-binding protein [Deltaproteobacteria bacterium]|nr:ABC transporter ATP-binding protein [Deltaproteobacteria bacterium]